METRPVARSSSSPRSTASARSRSCMRPDGDVAQEVELGRGHAHRRRPRAHRRRLAPAGVDVLVLGGGGEDRATSAPACSTWSASTPTRSTCPTGTGPTRAARATSRSSLFTGAGRRPRGRRGSPTGAGPCRPSAPRRRPRSTRRRHRLLRHAAAPLLVAADVARRRRSPAARGSRWRRASSPTTFWDEVRRYGVTVASYTWTMFRELVDAPAAPGRAPPPAAAADRLRHAARAVGARATRASRPRAWSSSTPRPRARRSSSTCARRSRARWAARCRARPRCASPPGTSSTGACARATTASRSRVARGEVGMLLARAQPGTPRRRRHAAARRLQARRRLGRRPATCSARTTTATSG